MENKVCNISYLLRLLTESVVVSIITQLISFLMPNMLIHVLNSAISEMVGYNLII